MTKIVQGSITLRERKKVKFLKAMGPLSEYMKRQDI